MDELKKKTETMLRAVLISSPRGVPLYRVEKEYRSITFEPIPYSKLGFTNLEGFLKSIPHVASIQRGSDGEVVVKGVASEADQHVAKLIAKQKKPKIRKSAARPRKPVYAFSATPNKYRGTNFGPRSQNFAPKSLIQNNTSTFGGNRGQTPRFVPPRLRKVLGADSQPAANQQPVNGTRRVSTDRFVGRWKQDVQKASMAGRAKQRVIESQVKATEKLEKILTSNERHKLYSSVGTEKRNDIQGNDTWFDMRKRDQKPKTNPSQISQRTVKSKGPNFQRLEVTLDNKPTSPQTKIPSSTIPTVTLSPEVLKNIKQIVGAKPNGLFLSRLSVDYKSTFGQELPGNFTETLLLHPEVTHIEKVHQLYIAYPPKKPEPPASESAKEISDITKQNKEEKKQKEELCIEKPFTVPDVGSSVQVYLSHVESVGNFFVQYKEYEDRIQDLQAKLDQDFKETTAFITKPIPGMYCCAKFSLDDSWYRGKILQCIDEKDTLTVEIFYVDFGNSEWLPSSRLQHLKKEHVELPQMAVHCSLEGKENFNLSMTETLKTFIDKELKMTLVQRIGDVLCVQLVDEEGADVAVRFDNKKPSKHISSEENLPVPEDNVTASEVVQPSSPPAVEQKKHVKPFLRSKSMTNEQEMKIPERVVIPNEDYIDILVFNVFSTDNINVLLYGEEYSDKLLALEVSLMSYFSESFEESPSSPKAGEIWALKTNELHSEDQWYRVKVLSIKDDQAQLEFVDYGDTRQAVVSDLKVLPARFLDLPFQAVTLSLNNIPKTKKKEVLDKLKQHVLEKPLVAEVIQRTQDKLSVELFDTSTETDININEIMRSLILPDEDLTPALPKAGQQVNVAVSHISDTGAVYVQIPGAGLSRLEELMTDITEHYNSKSTKAAEFVSQPTEGLICCAKCSDGSWYRALILKQLPERMVKVQCVDYGNTEIVLRTALREPTKANEHVSSLPFQAVECCLGSDLNWDADKTKAINQILSDEVILEVTKQGAIPQVKLFLTREDGQQAVNILDYILEDNQANRDDGSVDGSVDGSSPGKQEQTDKESSSQEDDQDDLTPNLPPPITLSRPWVDVTVFDVIDPGQFMFQPLSMLRDLEKLTSDMTEYYKNKSETVKSPRMGDLCAVRDKDGNYYRAVVKAVLSPKQVCVLFIDYGNLDIHTSSDFRVLCDQFKQLPCIAVKGSLSGIQPSESSGEWSVEATKRLEDLTRWKMLVASIDGDQYTYSYREEHKIHLTIYDTSSDKDINIADVLIQEGLARRTES